MKSESSLVVMKLYVSCEYISYVDNLNSNIHTVNRLEEEEEEEDGDFMDDDE